jgi:hypothetical protein
LNSMDSDTIPLCFGLGHQGHRINEDMGHPA